MMRKMWGKVWPFLQEHVARPWSDLRGISNSTAAKSTIIIPLVGYWIVFNENIVRVLEFSRELGLTQSQGQIPQRLLWLYVALTAIAVGTFIYAIRCPPQVKKYSDERDYINGDGPALGVPQMEDIETEMDHAQVYYNNIHGKNEVLGAHFKYLNYSNGVSRGAVSVLFAFGFALLAILSLRVFVKVFQLLIKSL